MYWFSFGRHRLHADSFLLDLNRSLQDKKPESMAQPCSAYNASQAPLERPLWVPNTRPFEMEDT
jgi:hypothetical protein